MKLDDIKSKAAEALEAVKGNADGVIEFAKDHADEAGEYLHEKFDDGVQKEDFEKIGNDIKDGIGKILGGKKEE